MKNILKVVSLCLLFMTCKSGPANNQTNLECDAYWTQVAFSDFCTMDMSHFDFTGQVDICKADSNEDFPFDELIYIRVYNAFSVSDAEADFLNEKAYVESRPGFMEVNNLGDNAFAELKIQLDKLDDVYIWIIKNNYYISIEVNANYSNTANNCLDVDTVFDFARAIVAPL